MFDYILIFLIGFVIGANAIVWWKDRNSKVIQSGEVVATKQWHDLKPGDYGYMKVFATKTKEKNPFIKGK